jgi:hypothetical protein
MHFFGANVNSLAGGTAGVMPQTATSASGAAPLKSLDKIRNVFPETWLWTHSTVR